MALSKHETKDVCNRIGKINWCKPLTRKIHDKEIKIHCFYRQKKAISVELIQHMLGGLNMEYKCINVEDSFKAFDYCANHLIQNLKDSKDEILYFEHRNNATSSILIVMTKQKKSNACREHPILLAVI